MDYIRRVPQHISGVADGVEMITKCVATTFDTDAEGNNIGIKEMEQKDCRVLCSETNQTLSISLKGEGYMLSLNGAELRLLLLEALKAFNDIPANNNLS